MPPETASGGVLAEGWRLALTPAGACAGPAEAATLEGWIDAVVPGTAAQALERAGRWRREAPTPLHDQDVWCRLDPTALGRGTLVFEGLATLAEVFLGGRQVLAARSMFETYEVDVDLSGDEALWICFRALWPALEAKGPRARWRPTMIERQGLRLVRTTLLGHMPGWCPPIHIVGPYRPIRFVPEGALRPRDVRIVADWDGAAHLSVDIVLPGLSAPPRLSCAGAEAEMQQTGPDRYRAELRPTGARPWFPHTHGEQALYPVQLKIGGQVVALGSTGFRRIEADRSDGGFSLRVNGEPIFCRGACWIAPDLVSPHKDPEPTLRLAREAGFNMLRVSGVGLYPDRAFYEACDRLGLLVWQDFMFANFDYPAGDEAFVASVRREAAAQLATWQGCPSLAVLCGGSEVMQQASMMGLPALAWPLFEGVLAEVAGEARPDVPYVPNTPYAGPLPFTVSEGVGHYYGVGAYQRPLEDARRANVAFAAECLALANVPQPESPAGLAVHDPRWKAGIPRDRGASWDFEDVRDHYLQRLFEVDPARLRREDVARYLDLSRMVSGEVMAAVFSEWRRGGSRCAGGLVWTLHDLQRGAGWGLIDSAGEPKPAWYALRRMLQPVAVTLTDEGVNGVAIHLHNETAAPVSGELRLTALGEDAVVLEATRTVEVLARSTLELSAFELIGRFFDISYAYRFGPRAHVAVRAVLTTDAGPAEATLVQTPTAGLSPAPVTTSLQPAGDEWILTLQSPRLLRYVHLSDRGWRPDDDGFLLAPGERRQVRLRRRSDTAAAPEGEVFGPGGDLLGSYAAP